MDLPFRFLVAEHGFSVALPREPVCVSRETIASWPGIGACLRSEFAVADSDGSVDLYLEVYAAVGEAPINDDEQRRWMAELAVRIGDGPVAASSTWVKDALLVHDAEGRSLIVPVRDGVCVLNIDAGTDLEACAAAFFSTFKRQGEDPRR